MFQPGKGQPYIRTLEASLHWQSLDCGWLKEASLLHLLNPFPLFEKQPTKEEADAAEALVVELGIRIGSEVDTIAYVPPGESPTFRPSDLSKLMVRCQTGTAEFRLTLFPK
jgi:hypothetical protein